MASDPQFTDWEIRAWLIERIARRTGRPAEQVAVDQAFAELGLTSIDATSLCSELEAWLGRSVSPLIVWDYPSIDLLTRYLCGEIEAVG